MARMGVTALGRAGSTRLENASSHRSRALQVGARPGSSAPPKPWCGARRERGSHASTDRAGPVGTVRLASPPTWTASGRGLEADAPAPSTQPLKQVRVLGIEEAVARRILQPLRMPNVSHENERAEQRLDVQGPIMADPGRVVALKNANPGNSRGRKRFSKRTCCGGARPIDDHLSGRQGTWDPRLRRLDTCRGPRKVGLDRARTQLHVVVAKRRKSPRLAAARLQAGP